MSDFTYDNDDFAAIKVASADLKKAEKLGFVVSASTAAAVFAR